MKAVQRYFKSLQFRIFLLLLIFGIVPCQALRSGILYLYQVRQVEARITDIDTQVKLLSHQIIHNDYLSSAQSGEITAEIEQLGSFYNARIVLVNDDFKVVTDTYHRGEGKILLSNDVNRAYSGIDVHDYDLKERFIHLAIPMLAEDGASVYGVALILTTMDFVAQGLEYISSWLSVVIGVVYLLVILMGLFLSRRMVHPLVDLERSIRDVQSGFRQDFHEINDYSETAGVSRAFGTLLKQMQSMDESRQEFVSNVSHELKTPLTSMKVLADSLAGAEGLPVEMYQEFMTDIVGQIDRENQIINDLLSLVRTDSGTGQELNIEKQNINDMLAALMKELTPIAEKQHVDLVLETFRPVTADVDSIKMSMALSNLIENAIKYNNSGGYVRVTLNADHQYYYVNVIDNGIGIPKEAQDRIFERFYRVDKSHSRAIGGTGLGLSITKNIIVLHRGEIKVHSVEGEGTTFAVKVPLTYARTGAVS